MSDGQERTAGRPAHAIMAVEQAQRRGMRHFFQCSAIKERTPTSAIITLIIANSLFIKESILLLIKKRSFSFERVPQVDLDLMFDNLSLR